MRRHISGQRRRIFPVVLVALVPIVLLIAGCSNPPVRLLNRLPDDSNKACVSNLGSKPTADPDFVKTESIAMPEDQFWALIGDLHGSNSDTAYNRLSTKLAALPTASILGFDARMTIALYELDDQCRADWYEKHDPTGLHFLADDDFLYVRADTVSAGRATWDKAITTDTLPWGKTDAVNRDGESLLYVGLNAASTHGISNDKWFDTDAKDIGLSYETASNPAGWAPSK